MTKKNSQNIKSRSKNPIIKEVSKNLDLPPELVYKVMLHYFKGTSREIKKNNLVTLKDIFKFKITKRRKRYWARLKNVFISNSDK